MSKLVFICSRHADRARTDPAQMDKLAKRLFPEHITPRPPLTATDSGACISVLNPCDASLLENMSAWVGHVVAATENWSEPGNAVPDGSFALFRADDNTVELVTDAVGSRTIWYVHTDDLFIASTSQRAIVCLLGDYRPNPEAVVWMLSSGTLGPGFSWDARIRCLPGDTVMRLDRKSWTATERTRPVTFDPLPMPDAEHEGSLRKTLDQTFQNLQLDYANWRLALSGGIDSRALLLYLPRQTSVKCITWGLSESIADPDSDSNVAQLLAKSFDFEHSFFATDSSDEPMGTILRRFTVAGEGRIDHVSAYMDGLRMWKTLHDEGISGVLRGDEGFGWNAVTGRSDVRRSLDAFLLSDFPNIGDPARFGLGPQTWPADLERRHDESLAAWRDRLYHQFRIPSILAALNDLKCCYVEVANPLLSRAIIENVRRMPDHLRTDKKLFRKIVLEQSPRIGFAKSPAIADLGGVLRSREVVEVVRNELERDITKDVIPVELIAYVRRNSEVAEDAGEPRIRGRLARVVPRSVKNVLRTTIMKPNLHPNVLGFRAYLASTMNQLLGSDAKSGAPTVSDRG